MLRFYAFIYRPFNKPKNTKRSIHAAEEEAPASQRNLGTQLDPQNLWPTSKWNHWALGHQNSWAHIRNVLICKKNVVDESHITVKLRWFNVNRLGAVNTFLCFAFISLLILFPMAIISAVFTVVFSEGEVVAVAAVGLVVPLCRCRYFFMILVIA